MQQVAAWLEKLGMSEYAGRFAENRIDFSALRDLTDQDLRDLGVVLGDRRKLLRAIGELSGADHKATSGTSVSPQGNAERRQLTIMFCDLVGSTTLSAQLSTQRTLPRDFVVYHRCSAAIVERMAVFFADPWVTACSSILAIRKRTKTTPSAPC